MLQKNAINQHRDLSGIVNLAASIAATALIGIGYFAALTQPMVGA